MRKAYLSARDLLVAGRYDGAVKQTTSASQLAQKWVEAEKAYKAYMEAETAVSAIKGKAGAQAVERSLRQAQASLTGGRYDEVPRQSLSALALLEKWIVAEKTYSEVENAVAAIKGKAGSQAVERSLSQALESLVAGRYDEVSVKGRSTLDLFSKWQAAYEAYLRAEKAILSVKPGPGLDRVKQAFGQANELLAAGEYDQAPETARLGGS